MSKQVTSHKRLQTSVFVLIVSRPVKWRDVASGSQIKHTNRARGRNWTSFSRKIRGVDGKRNGVGVIPKEKQAKNVADVKRVSDSVMGDMLNI